MLVVLITSLLCIMMRQMDQLLDCSGADGPLQRLIEEVAALLRLAATLDASM